MRRVWPRPSPRRACTRRRRRCAACVTTSGPAGAAAGRAPPAAAGHVGSGVATDPGPGRRRSPGARRRGVPGPPAASAPGPRCGVTTATWTGPGPSGGTASTVSPRGEGLVTAEVVAAHLAVDVSTVYRLASSGALPVVAIGQAKRFRVEDVRAFVERQTRGAAEQSCDVDRVRQLLAGARRGTSRRSRPARSNEFDVCAPQSVHGASKQEPWRPPGPRTKETS